MVREMGGIKSILLYQNIFKKKMLSFNRKLNPADVMFDINVFCKWTSGNISIVGILA
jgi:hypothetical protein